MYKENEIMNPLLSVCLITYNHVNYIKQAIEGVLMQQVNFTWELIIADDFSTDGTREILFEYQKAYPHLIKLILQPENVGAAKNWLDLIRYPRAKYIAYFEGDDYWLTTEKLQLQVGFLENNPGYSGCIHETKIEDEVNEKNSKIFAADIFKDITAEDTIAQWSLFHTSSFVFRRSALVVPEWLYKVTSGDMALFSIVASSGPIKKIDGVMSVYRKHTAGLAESNYKKSNIYDINIELINYLNEFHQYKYESKARKVISLHLQEREIVQKKITLFDRLKRFFYIKI